MTVSIATVLNRALRRNGSRRSLALEVPFSEIAEESRARSTSGRKPAVLQGNRRADIVVCNSRGCPVGVIEVKRAWVYQTCTNDLNRMQSLLKRFGQERGGTIQFGVLAVFIATSNAGRSLSIEQWKEKIEEEAGSYLDGKVLFRCHGGRRMRLDTSERFGAGWEASSMCIELYGKQPLQL